MATRSRKKKPASEDLAEYRKKRDFSKTSEPSGGSTTSNPATLRFVIQKHRASHLHFDLRLELDGVMKSWAVPKGPSTDPAVKRLAMEVEDHPIEYNSFEGTIPKGEYGGGTVMLWDQGTYTPEDTSAPDQADTIRAGYEKGDLKITFFGERMQGSWVLVRMKGERSKSSSKPQWLFMKHRDDFVSTDDIVAEFDTSVTTGRTMDEIASGESKVWHSNRSSATTKRSSRATPPQPLEPMYASVGKSVPGEGWTFEPKYDGIRVLAYVTPDETMLMTRNGKDKAAQFPEIIEALQEISRSKKATNFVVDGEIVALADGEPARFQNLQGRMHVKESGAINRHRKASPAALILFDLLAMRDEILLAEPWLERRTRLVDELDEFTGEIIRITDSFEEDGQQMLAVAQAGGWEGLIAKRIDSLYEPGRRSKNWLKLKIEFRQEFVVGGFTEPRNSRQHIGALLLGYYNRGRFIYVGHTGGGFTAAGLAEMFALLEPLKQKKSPFEETPKTNEQAHWVSPHVVVEVKFNEWTSDGKLRQPIYLGRRDDKQASEIGREGASMQKETSGKKASSARKKTGSKKTGSGKSSARRRVYAQRTLADDGSAKKKKTPGAKAPAVAPIVEQLDEIEASGSGGTVNISKSGSLDVTNLGKVFFPSKRLTKGDLMRYYATVAPFILPVMADRPLVLKRFPNGVEGQSFFQQNAGEPPEPVRTETIHTEGGSTNLRVVGGDLLTLLYTVQLGAISVDPWHSRVTSLDFADYSIIDLDPGPRAPFGRVVEVARLVKETMDALGLHGGLKTSGSSGLHVYLPLPPETPNEAATLVAQIVATRVSDAHPRLATIERFVKKRGPSTVYVDYLQNIIGKTVAAAYSARANADAMVSTPLRWDELTDDLDPREFTIETAPERFADAGDIWAEMLKKKNSLESLG